MLWEGPPRICTPLSSVAGKALARNVDKRASPQERKKRVTNVPSMGAYQPTVKILGLLSHPCRPSQVITVGSETAMEAK